MERSIISAQDVLLPDFFGAESRGTAAVLASTDEAGAGAMGRRIQKNVREHPEFRCSGLTAAYRVHLLPVDAWAKANDEQHVLSELTAKIEAVMHGASQHEECRNA